jgi:hypothetical protein
MGSAGAISPGNSENCNHFVIDKRRPTWYNQDRNKERGTEK